jgi:hypothetical protein
MTENIHERARQLILSERIGDLGSADRQWLEDHFSDCEECSRFADSLDNAISTIRMPAVMAGAALVRATQTRVRNRALELNLHAAAMRPLWIAVGLVCAWAALTTPLLWAASAWLGAAFSLSTAEWRTGFVFAWIAPTLVASLLLLGSGSNRLRWRMALGLNSENV